MEGYVQSIKNNWTTIYIFYKNDEIQFVIEIYGNKVIQARRKYNNPLNIDDEIVLKLG
jgi:hypothetical protein